MRATLCAALAVLGALALTPIAHAAPCVRVGVYQDPIADGNAIHSLEHGIVWIAYNPALIQPGSVRALEDLGRDYGADTIVAPRPENTAAMSAMSCGPSPARS